MSPHSFHIPVMGLGYTADSPIRVGRFGIDSVVSIVEDNLLEDLRLHYAARYGLPAEAIPKNTPDARARRIRCYLDLLQDVLDIQMAEIRSLPFFEDNDKRTYFELLPDASPLKQDYQTLLGRPDGPVRDTLAADLSRRMVPGRIDVNLMVKVDATPRDSEGKALEGYESDAKSAMRGFVESRVRGGAAVLSAGINKALFTFMSNFREFYRDATGHAAKKIVLKVSDMRSSLVQGRFLAKKGLEIYEYRVESGLNCGGHTFATNGLLLSAAAAEFVQNRDQLTTEFADTVREYYAKQGWAYVEPAEGVRPRVTIQGGIGASGENRRLLEDFGMDATGWGTPFLLVPEATAVDADTRALLAAGGEGDFYLSGASPFGIPFNNLRGTGSERHAARRAAEGRSGAACTRRFLVSNTEYTAHPICTGSRQYQSRKLAELDGLNLSDKERERRRAAITAKECLCANLCNSALIDLGIVEKEEAPQCICPGPNGRWFSRNYTLREMVDHIYGRRESLVPAERPHMFAAEIVLYVDYFERETRDSDGSAAAVKALDVFRENLESGMTHCLGIAETPAYPGENLESLKTAVIRERRRLSAIHAAFQRKVGLLRQLESGQTVEVEPLRAVAGA